MPKFYCPECKATTPHKEPTPDTKNKSVLLECKNCGIGRTIENIHSIYCDKCQKITPNQLKRNEYTKSTIAVCLVCGFEKIL